MNLHFQIYQKPHLLILYCLSGTLFQQITYFSNSKSARKRIEKVPITERDTHGCDANQEELIRVNIEIPPIPPTDHSSSNIVKVKYMIRVSENDNQYYHSQFQHLFGIFSIIEGYWITQWVPSQSTTRVAYHHWLVSNRRCISICHSSETIARCFGCIIKQYDHTPASRYTIPRSK